jgi:hypothetical protein
MNPYIRHDLPERYRITRDDKGQSPSPRGERGYGAASLLLEALARAKLRARGIVPMLRTIEYEKLHDVPVFTKWGQARLFTYDLWEMKPDAWNPEVMIRSRVKPTYLPALEVGDLLGHRPVSRFRVAPDTKVVRVTWGGPKKATIDEDLLKLGLFSRGYEGRLDNLVKDEILSRTAMRLNRLFWRNVDGTPIPNVSFGISFTAEPLPGGRKPDWTVLIAGDDPDAGGRASNPFALVFSSNIVRNMYVSRALDPATSREDLDYFTGRYRWGSAVNRNIRYEEIRCLIDGFSGALSLTGAHELGHLAGLGHDVASPRSIMNVREGGGLDPDWAEWIPAHIKMLESRLGRDNGRRR